MIIEAVCVTSTKIERAKIRFNEESGLIEEFGHFDGTPDIVYGDECLLFAGMGDVHIHAREDLSQKNTYKEDFTSAQQAMHNGGVCHAGDMPNNPIPPIDEKSYIDKLKLAAAKTSGEIWIYGGIGPETSPVKFPIPYKAYMGPSIGELYFKNFDELDRALSRYENQWVSFHCEDPELLEKSKSAPTHNERRPVEAEVLATKDALKLIKKYKLKGKLCHYSSGEGLDVIREARKEGLEVKIEVTPQHLFYGLEEIPSERLISFQMNPPIRENSDRVRLLEALKNGEIDFLATDHAPHTDEEKAKGTSGLTGLDTFGAFVTWLIQIQNVDPKLIAKITAENPGRFFNEFLPSFKMISTEYEKMGNGLGFLTPGFRANFTVLNLSKKILITKDQLKTKVKHSPFLGVTFPGQVEALYIGGKRK